MPQSKTQGQQPLPGNQNENPPTGKNCCPRTKIKGHRGRDRDRGCFEGCLAVLCCCWLCEVCLDA